MFSKFVLCYAHVPALLFIDNNEPMQYQSRSHIFIKAYKQQVNKTQPMHSAVLTAHSNTLIVNPYLA